ncbi:MAG: hypothetical protein IJ225_11290 [Solobacterium sp.]|nr:hypothetical protein [Solobacterium sp.]
MTRTIEAHYDYVVSIRFQNSGRSYTFGTSLANLKTGDKVVVETSQGIELGVCQSGSTPSDIYPVPKSPLMPVLRKADQEDLADYAENLEYAKDAFAVCEEEIQALGLGMRLLSAEYMLDRSKILFVYQADQRVDFRELLKILGSRLHCRIELRQIGERDKAKMVGGIGLCGMECCCARFKTRMDVISINMAKNQLLALNTEKLSGMCGKLMCCLKYEDANYKELTAGLPKMGAHVEYEGTMYRVTSMNVMTNEARLENSESYEVISIDDLREKTVVRKGVAVGRKTPQRGAKQTHIAPGVRNVHEERGSFSASESEKSRGISAESKDTSHQNNADLKLRNEHRSRPNTQKKEAQARPNNRKENGNRRSSNNNNNRRRETPRRTADTNNPNVTVRSFKSSKTRAEEAAKGAQ